MHLHVGHDHHGHDLAEGNASSRALLTGLLITLGFALIELLGGWWFGSLALMSDAGHMFSDSGALFIAMLASQVAKKPAGVRHSYGFSRAEVIAALLNGLLLLGIVGVIVVEAISRLRTPQAVSGGGVILIAFLGLIVNALVLRVLGKGGQDMNTRAAKLHVLGDLAGSVAALTAGLVILISGWYPIDPILSFVISALILVSTLRILRDAVHVLMEGVPPDIDLQKLGKDITEIPGISSVHDLHVWTIASGRVALSAHVEVDTLSNWPAMLERVRSLAYSNFGIAHVTIQPEVKGGINSGREARIPIVPHEI